MAQDCLLSFNDVWPYIRAAVKRRPDRCSVAVAYFGTGASRMLPLEGGSSLVVDMSKRSVGGGLTNPSEIIKLLRRGVRAYNVENLHAKVFVLGDRAVVGSSNASRTSANSLVEAALVTTKRNLVGECKSFVDALKGEEITAKFAKEMQKLWQPPPRDALRKAPNGKVPSHSEFWVTPLFGDASPREYREADEGTSRAESQFRDPDTRSSIGSPGGD